MKNSIKKITNDGVENLIIDLTFNGGGMADNIYYTLDYLTDKTIRLVYKYSITDESREIAKTVISNESFLKEEDREFLINYIDSVPAGSKFRTDTIRFLRNTARHTGLHRLPANIAEDTTKSQETHRERNCRFSNGMISTSHIWLI